MGVGVGLFVENIGPMPLELSGGSARWLVRKIALDFNPRPRNEMVME